MDLLLGLLVIIMILVIILESELGQLPTRRDHLKSQGYRNELIQWHLPVRRGREGEKFVAKELYKLLDSNYYRILNNLLLPSTGNLNTAQIDHVIVSNFGIFCLETKAYAGWIFGNIKQKYWTQVIFHNKERFYNPFYQNYAHIKALEKVIGRSQLKSPIISLVIFTDADKLKISGTDAAGFTFEIIRKIKNYSIPIYTDTERDAIYNLLCQANITDITLQKLHNKNVQRLKY